MDLGLQGKVALVTGGSSGIGRAIVDVLLQEGALVANVDRNVLDQAEVLNINGDLVESAFCESAVAQTIEHLGRLDIVINNAGVNDVAGLDAGPKAFLESIQKNLVHAYTIVHHAREQLIVNKGAIVNVGSKVAITGQGGTSGYAAAKGGLVALTREWAADLAQYAVRVNTVLPAEVWTEMYERWLERSGNPIEARNEIARYIPLEQRFTTPVEIASMVVFLASSRSSHTTGEIICVDGGYTHLDRQLS